MLCWPGTSAGGPAQGLQGPALSWGSYPRSCWRCCRPACPAPAASPWVPALRASSLQTAPISCRTEPSKGAPPPPLRPVLQVNLTAHTRRIPSCFPRQTPLLLTGACLSPWVPRCRKAVCKVSCDSSHPGPLTNAWFQEHLLQNPALLERAPGSSLLTAPPGIERTDRCPFAQVVAEDGRCFQLFPTKNSPPRVSP